MKKNETHPTGSQPAAVRPPRPNVHVHTYIHVYRGTEVYMVDVNTPPNEALKKPSRCLLDTTARISAPPTCSRHIKASVEKYILFL